MIRDGRIVQQVVFPVSRETLFAWFADPKLVASWMGSAAQTDIRPGGVYSCILPAGQAWDGVVVEVAEPFRLVVTLGWRDPTRGLPAGMSLVVWEFALDARGTRLRMVHEHVPAELLSPLNDVWGRLFARLRNVLAGRPIGPHPLANFPRQPVDLDAEAGPT